MQLSSGNDSSTQMEDNGRFRSKEHTWREHIDLPWRILAGHMSILVTTTKTGTFSASARPKCSLVIPTIPALLPTYSRYKGCQYSSFSVPPAASWLTENVLHQTHSRLWSRCRRGRGTKWGDSAHFKCSQLLAKESFLHSSNKVLWSLESFHLPRIIHLGPLSDWESWGTCPRILPIYP